LVKSYKKVQKSSKKPVDKINFKPNNNIMNTAMDLVKQSNTKKEAAVSPQATRPSQMYGQAAASFYFL